MSKYFRVEFIVIDAAITALVIALVSQYAFDFYPCEMCIWQRWGYATAIVFALAALKFPKARYLMTLGLIATCGIAIFHFGVEQKWWEGFTTCTSSFSGGSIEELRAQIMEAPVVRCDEATWVFLGLSMAGWNVLYSGILSLYGIKSLFNRRRAG